MIFSLSNSAFFVLSNLFKHAEENDGIQCFLFARVFLKGFHLRDMLLYYKSYFLVNVNILSYVNKILVT